MKVEGVQKSGASRSASKTKKTSSNVDFSGVLGEVDQAKATSQIEAVSAVASIDAVMALQSVDDALFAKKKAVQKGQDILEKLEDLRQSILFGQVKPQDLMKISDQLSSIHQEHLDPKLKNILNEIQLRAEVEMAKYAALKA